MFCSWWTRITIWITERGVLERRFDQPRGSLSERQLWKSVAFAYLRDIKQLQVKWFNECEAEYGHLLDLLSVENNPLCSSQNAKLCGCEFAIYGGNGFVPHIIRNVVCLGDRSDTRGFRHWQIRLFFSLRRLWTSKNFARLPSRVSVVRRKLHPSFWRASDDQILLQWWSRVLARSRF